MGDAKRRGEYTDRKAKPKGAGWRKNQSNQRTTKLTQHRIVGRAAK